MAENFFKTNRELVVFSALSVLVVAIYWQTTGFGFINLDDNQYVFDNAAVRSGLNTESLKWALTAFHSANWHPLTWLAHMLDVRLFGLSAGGHHATNIILHLVNSLLAFVVFRRMTGCLWKSATVAALFAVHPAHVESVAWISERKDVLSTLFWLLAMLAYLRYAEERRRGEGGRKRGGEEETDDVEVTESNRDDKGDENEISPSPLLRFSFSPLLSSYLLVLLLLALGLTAKPMLVTLPFVFLLMDFWPLGRLKGGRGLFRPFVEKIPFFALSAASSYVTILAQRSVGAVESLDYLPLETRLVNALVAYVKYIATLFYPAGLAVWYPYDREFPVWQIAGASLLLVAVTALALRQMRKRGYLLMGWLWFLGTLVPVIGLVQVGSQPMADRYTYIPYFGLFLMLVWGAADLFKTLDLSRKPLRVLFVAAVLGLALLSFRQTAFWRNNETLYKHALAVTKDNFLISHNLCYTLTVEGRLDEAEPFCRDTIRVKPDYHEVYNTLGVLQLKRGQHAEAERSFLEVLRLAPNYNLAYVNLSVAQSMLGKPAEAEASLEKAVRSSDSAAVQSEVWINALNTLAIAFTGRQNYDKAAESLARILALDVNNAPARANLALTYYHLKRYDEAQKLIESALQLNPNEAGAYNTYGLILLAQNNPTAAAGLFERALQLKPDYTDAKENLKKARGEK